MKMRRIGFVLLLLLGWGALWGLHPEEGALLARIVDVGAGHAAVARVPGGGVIVFDAGGGSATLEKIDELIGADAVIDLLVVSHTDADHLAGADDVLAGHTVRWILRPGRERDTYAWREFDAAVTREVEDEGAVVFDLSETHLPAGTAWPVGDGLATMVAGFAVPPVEWRLSGSSETNNAGSIAIRLMFAGRSILFTGDAVGRHSGAPPNTCIATERFMVVNEEEVPIEADVLIAPHHGADNGCSELFLETVDPEWVVFPAGHRYDHPRSSAAARVLASGVLLENILRTDRGDDEGGAEWDGERVDGHKDGKGDDDVDILIRADGTVEVAYRD